MTRLTEEMVIARTRANDLANIRKLNVWGSGLSDVSLLRKMQNVEVLSLSVNKINSLEDFQWCRNLQELYVRRNEIKDLNQVCYLRDLPRLRSLWLDENPCAACDLYRVTVLRALPHLQKLDNVPVAPEEVQEALRRGLELCHPEEPRQDDPPPPAIPQPQLSPQRHEGYDHYPPPPPQQQQQQELSHYYDDFEEPPRTPHPQHLQRGVTGRHGAPSDPDSEPEAHHHALQQQQTQRRPSQQQQQQQHYNDDEPYYAEHDRRNANYEPDPAATGYGRTVNNQYHNNIYDETTPGSEDYGNGRGGGGRGGGRADTYSSDGGSSNGNGSSSYNGRASHPHHHSNDDVVYARQPPPAQLELHHAAPQLAQPPSQRCSPGPQQVLLPAAGGGGGSRRPVTRVWNSNILSAVLCLIKELDFPSLEVVEVAVRSRMDEF